MGDLELPPDEKITLTVDPQPDLESLDIQYTLKNLKTEKVRYTNNRLGLGAFILEAGDEYEFHIGYVAQPESVGVTYLKAKAKWYRSPFIYIFILALFSALAIGFIIARYKKRLKSSEESQQKMEGDALRLQSLLNPHFTFNALSTIQGLMNFLRLTTC